MTLDKLKVAARQHEQREEWREAIELYRQAAREAGGSGEGGDPTIFNRIGDLEHRLGDHRAACEAWDQAAVRYGEHGLTNNAIALCAKILRLEPSRIRTYLDLATFQARKQMLFEVRTNLTSYRDRMHTVGQVEACHDALVSFGENFAGWPDLRGVVDELLGREQGDAEIHVDGTEPKDRGQRLVFIDTGPVDSDQSAPQRTDVPLEVEPTALGGIELERGTIAGGISGLEPTAAGDDVEAASIGQVEGLVDVQRTAAAVGETGHLEGFDPGIAETAPQPSDIPTIRLDGLESREFTPPDEPIPAIRTTNPNVVLIDLDLPKAEAPPAVEPVPDAEPDDPLGQRVRAQALLERGDRAGGVSGLERALTLYTEAEEWLHVWQVAGELIQAEPQSIDRYQARVETAARMQDKVRLCESYHALGDALVRAGSTEKATAVYRRLLELDEHHPGARAALRAMVPEGETPQVPEGFVDFGAMVIDDAGPRSTRMRTETTAISADEDETFREALAEFKRALDQNVAVEDYQAHYDLGIAFKEMGLLDEAVNSFQKALRATEGRLRTAEALGATFLEKGMPPVAEAVLRSVERGPEDDAEKIGVLYWLGRALESQGKGSDARGCYERVLAVDVTFMDTSDRIVQLGSGHAS